MVDFKKLTPQELGLRGYMDAPPDEFHVIESELDFEELAKKIQDNGGFNSNLRDALSKHGLETLREIKKFEKNGVRTALVVGAEDTLIQSPSHDFRGGWMVYECYAIEPTEGVIKILSKRIGYREY